ncbi:MAG: hypothetical protein D6826_11280, partial [Alphaproteobacteria bacterium]
MAQKQSAATTQTPQDKRAARGGNSLLTALMLLPAVAVLLPSCVVLLIGMIPTVVAYMVDRSRAKSLAVTVGLVNFCGTLPGLAELWESWQDYEVAAAIATDS